MHPNKIINEDLDDICSANIDWSRFEGKTILVTGANGFLPAYIIETLLHLQQMGIVDDLTVIALVRNNIKAELKFQHHLANKSLLFLVQDVSETIRIEQDIDYIVHAASQASPKYYGVDPVGTLKANTLGTYNALELAREKNVERVLYFSSGEVYGTLPTGVKYIKESDYGYLDPLSIRACYGESKRMGENMCASWATQYEVPVSIVRPFHTAGPGSINVVNGLVGGWTDSAPMMVVSGQSALSCVEYQKASGIRQYGIQGIFIRPFVEKACKYFITVDDPTKIKYYLEKAYHLATTGRPGPVWIDVPLDIQRMNVPETLTYGYSPEKIDLSFTDRSTFVGKTLDMLSQARRPVIIAGQGVRLSGAAEALRELIEKLRIPVITSRLGIDLIESDHELYVGRPGNYGERSANFAIQNADLILAIGSRLATATVGHDAKQFGRNAKKIVVDIDPKELDKPGIKIDLRIQDDAFAFLNMLIQRSQPVDDPRRELWVTRCNLWKTKYPVVLPEYSDLSQEKVNSYFLVDKISEKADKDYMIMVDTGSCFHVACQAWKIKRDQRFLTTGGLSSMGYWVAGIGACVANDYKKTIVITGDGSFQMNIQDLATIVHQKLPIKIFIFNNNGYLLIRQTQHNFMDDRFYGEGPDTGVWCPDALKIADSYGIKGVRISNVSELDVKIQEVLDYDGPVICDVLTPEWQLIIPRISSDKMPDGRLVMRKYEDMFPFLPADEFEANMKEESI